MLVLLAEKTVQKSKRRYIRAVDLNNPEVPVKSHCVFSDLIPITFTGVPSEFLESTSFMVEDPFTFEQVQLEVSSNTLLCGITTCTFEPGHDAVEYGTNMWAYICVRGRICGLCCVVIAVHYARTMIL